MFHISSQSITGRTKPRTPVKEKATVLQSTYQILCTLSLLLTNDRMNRAPTDAERISNDSGSDDMEVKETREETQKWFNAKHYKGLSKELREKIVEAFVDLQHHEQVVDWHHRHRLMVWRAVVRANFWWVNPDTAEWTGKAVPINVPSGAYEHNFELFVQCAAEREDRLGRDLPHPEYVKKVEDEVRAFMEMVRERHDLIGLAHLAFLLMFDEGKKPKAIAMDEMQERLGLAFPGVGINWEGAKIFTPQTYTPAAGSTLALAEGIWQTACQELGI